MTPKPRFNWRHQYDQNRDEEEGQLAGLECKDPSLTVQSFAKDADLNVIAKRFGITDPAQLGSPDPAHFRDTTNDPELRDILELKRQVHDSYLSLSPKLRKRFRSPAEILEFLEDPDNAQEAVRLGLLTTAPAADAGPSATDKSPGGTASDTPKEPQKGSPEKTEGAPKAPSTP